MKQYKRFFESEYDDLYGFNSEEELEAIKKQKEELDKKIDLFMKTLNIYLSNTKKDMNKRSNMSTDQLQRYSPLFSRYDEINLGASLKYFLKILIDGKFIPLSKANKQILSGFNELQGLSHAGEIDNHVKSIKYVIDFMQEYFLTPGKGINKVKKGFPAKYASGVHSRGF